MRPPEVNHRRLSRDRERNSEMRTNVQEGPYLATKSSDVHGETQGLVLNLDARQLPGDDLGRRHDKDERAVRSQRG